MTSKPKTFSLHWGNGIVAEEAQVKTQHHIPTLQLLRYTDGELEGKVAFRFAEPGSPKHEAPIPCLAGSTWPGSASPSGQQPDRPACSRD